MNTMRSILDLSMQGKSLPVNTFVVASEPWIAQLTASIDDEQSQAFKPKPMDAGDALPADILGVAELLVVEVDPAVPGSIERIAQLRDARPSVPLIAAIEHADLKLVRSLMRQGVDDVVSLPFDFEELFDEIMQATADKAEKGEGALAPMLTVVSAMGGAGSSSVISELAVAMAAQPDCKRGCCVIDLDLQFGDIAHHYGVKIKSNVLDMLEAGSRLDGDMLRDAAVDTGRGVHVIGAPTQISPIEDVDVESLLRLVSLAREQYGFVLLDLPSSWTNWALSAALACSEIIIVTEQSITGLRQAKRCIDLFDQVDVPGSQVKIVLNHAEKKLFQAIGTQDVADTLKREVIVSLPAEKNPLSQYQDQGQLLSENSPRSTFVKGIGTLADNLTQRLLGHET